MNVLGLIPARGGSKGISGKNLAPLCGRPLIAYTCEAARASRRLKRVVVSTDNRDIAGVAEQLGIEVPFMRPPSLAGDDTLMIDVVRHALLLLAEQGYRPDAVAILQPTSPLRRASHIDAAIDRFETSGADAIVSVVRIPHQFTPGSAMRLEGGKLLPYETTTAPLRRQDKTVLFARNGPAILVVRRSEIEAGSFYGSNVEGLEMDAVDSVDIDTADDLAAAEFWLTRRKLADEC